MCNAWNHAPDCTCGWGGEGHLGVSPGGSAGYLVPGTYTWQYRDDEVCRPTKCPTCGNPVFFVRHNGGSVWFDQLGPPWPKHPCSHSDRYSARLHTMLRAAAVEEDSSGFGVVVEVQLGSPEDDMLIRVRGWDNRLIDWRRRPRQHQSHLLGRLVALRSAASGEVALELVGQAELRKFAYFQIVDGDDRVVSEFLYRERPMAEQQLANLNARCPGGFRLRICKRYEWV